MLRELVEAIGRQRVVNFVLKFWFVMPLKARIWAFMNDDDFREGHETWWNNKKVR